MTVLFKSLRFVSNVGNHMKYSYSAWPACLLAVLIACFASVRLVAAPVDSHVKSLPELEYGVVLYDYFQRNYFSALVEYEYSYSQNNEVALAPSGRVLKGGMMLSYGMPQASQELFNVLLDSTASRDVSNRAWYYLAKIYYNKSEFKNANDALNKIDSIVPDDIFFDYYYLATLIGNKKSLKDFNQSTQNNLSSYLPGYPYFLFNLAIVSLKSGDIEETTNYLKKVSEYSDKSEELSLLSDRAKNGLAQLALEAGELPVAWNHLSGIRTTGLYSNRALLAYAWSAIKSEEYNQAIPALKLLNQRSIAIPEVQETKVLLAYLYEKQNLPRKALESNIIAEKEFKIGIEKVTEARRIIDGLDVPREFINNIEAIMAKSDWYSTSPSVDYQKLTPFLIDLMASNAFSEVLRELADLYVIRDNLNYWLGRSVEHKVILENADKKNFDSELSNFFTKSEDLKAQFSNKKAELNLYTLTLAEKDQERMTALLETAQKELEFLESKVTKLTQLDSAYKQPASYKQLVQENRRRLEQQLSKTESYIYRLEPVMRKLVNAELDKHENRIRYYWAQSRLAKARLYDKELLSLERPRALSDASDKIRPETLRSETRVK